MAVVRPAFEHGRERGACEDVEQDEDYGQEPDDCQDYSQDPPAG